MAAVAMAEVESTERWTTLCAELEGQELDSAGGVATAQLYGQLLGLYLLKQDLTNAKFLWKRIPGSIKVANPELACVWLVGQKLWQKDFPGVYEALNRDWTDSLRPIMDAVRVCDTACVEATRKRAFGLVSRAYSSIGVDDFASFIGLPVSEAVEAAVSRGWTFDKSIRLLTPLLPVATPTASIPSEQYLSRLTDFVAFLEN